MTENTLSILIVNFSVQLQQTEISERKLFIFHLSFQPSLQRPTVPQQTSDLIHNWQLQMQDGIFQATPLLTLSAICHLHVDINVYCSG